MGKERGMKGKVVEKKESTAETDAMKNRFNIKTVKICNSTYV